MLQRRIPTSKVKNLDNNDNMLLHVGLQLSLEHLNYVGLSAATFTAGDWCVQVKLVIIVLPPGATSGNHVTETVALIFIL